MTPDEFRRFGYQAIDWVADYLEHADRYPVLPPVKPGELTDALPACGPEQGEPMETILADFEHLIVPAMTQWNHPGFMAYFANSAPPAGILGELLTAALNGNGMLWKTSPAVTELEQVALRWLRQWSGLPEDWFGLIYDTASTSSPHALAAAREAADPLSRTRGLHSLALVVYTSEQAHSSIEKGAIAVGIGQDHVRKIAVDAEFRMRPDALEAAIERDLAGRPEALLRERHYRHDLHYERRSGAGDRRHLRTPWPVAPRGRGVCGLGGDSARVPLGLRRLRARRFLRHQSSQVDDDTDGLQHLLYPPSRHSEACVLADPRVPAKRRRSARRQSDGLRSAVRRVDSAR